MGTAALRVVYRTVSESLDRITAFLRPIPNIDGRASRKDRVFLSVGE